MLENYYYIFIRPKQHYKVSNGVFLYSAVSSHRNCSKRFLGEAFSSATIIARRLFVQISTRVCSQVLIYTAERTVTTWDERNCERFETAAKGFEPGFSRLRARRSSRYASAPDTNVEGLVGTGTLDVGLKNGWRFASKIGGR